MIVRAEGDSLLLVRQADHALLSGSLAAAWGAEPWQAPEPYHSVVVGARLHDLAWTPFDETLARRPDGRPYAFFEVDRVLLTRLYGRGLDAVEALDGYAALLGSLHYTGFFTSHWGWRHRTSSSALQGEEKEAVEAFLGAEAARQRRLRDRLGVDQAQERQLMCNYLWLQLWDRISLDVCRHGFHGWSDDYPAVPASAAPGAAEARLHVELEPGGVCHLEPYPLRGGPFRAAVLAVRVPLAATKEAGALRRAWTAGAGEVIEVSFQPF